MTKVEQVREASAKALRDKYMSYGYCTTTYEETPYKEYWKSLADAVLSVHLTPTHTLLSLLEMLDRGELYVKDEDQSLPEVLDLGSFRTMSEAYTNKSSKASFQDALLKANFLKVKPLGG